MLLYRNNPFCELSDYPVYPPYANGSYLEDYFAMRFLSEGLQEQVDRKYIPVLWTPYYIKRNMAGQPNIPNDEPLQSWLDSLNPNDKYFVVSQHDDAPMHRLPKDTLVFSAGGNYTGKNTMPIPLLCSKIPNHLIPDIEERDILVSFVGSDTHPIRRRSIDSIIGKNRVFVKSRGWNNTVPTNNLTEFLSVTSRSEFCLCPRGYGKSSFRMYECMQMGTIPVYVSDEPYLPWLDELDWNDFCVLVGEDDIPNIYDILSGISGEEKNKMRNKMKEVYDSYFNMSGLYDNILKRLERLD